jgi:hypothetical protein
MHHPKRLGTTFSQLQCGYLGLDTQETFNRLVEMGFKLIRLCSYWHEIQPVRQRFNFSVLDWLVNEAQRHAIEVVLTVGMKAPRWPEFHFPEWVKDQYDTNRLDVPLDIDLALADLTLNFVKSTVERYRNVSNIKYWQVENEPLTRLEVGAGRYVSEEFIRREIELVRHLMHPDQKVLLTNTVTLWPPFSQEDEESFQATLALSDAVGVNVYTKVPHGANSYIEPSPVYWRKLKRWQARLRETCKESWVAESQAEPWEANKLVAIEQVNYPSSSPKAAMELSCRLAQIGYDPILLWGCEYWYWQEKRGYTAWRDMVYKLLHD